MLIRNIWAVHGPMPRTTVRWATTSSSDSRPIRSRATSPEATLSARSRIEAALDPLRPHDRAAPAPGWPGPVPAAHVAVERVDEPAVDRGRGPAGQLLVDDVAGQVAEAPVGRHPPPGAAAGRAGRPGRPAPGRRRPARRRRRTAGAGGTATMMPGGSPTAAVPGVGSAHGPDGRSRDAREEDAMDGDVVSVERVIPAGPAAIFALLADASRHPEIDGSGTVQAGQAGRARRPSSLGSTFGMSMRQGLGVLDGVDGHRVRAGPADRLAEPARRVRRPVRGRPHLALRARAGARAAPGSARAGTSARTTSGPCCASAACPTRRPPTWPGPWSASRRSSPPR